MQYQLHKVVLLHRTFLLVQHISFLIRMNQLHLFAALRFCHYNIPGNYSFGHTVLYLWLNLEHFIAIGYTFTALLLRLGID